MRLSAVVSSGTQSIRISGPTLPLQTPADQALEAIDELHDLLVAGGWETAAGDVVAVSGRIHFVAEAHHKSAGAAVCVYSTSDRNRPAARGRAARALTAAQLAQAATRT